MDWTYLKKLCEFFSVQVLANILVEGEIPEDPIKEETSATEKTVTPQMAEISKDLREASVLLIWYKPHQIQILDIRR